MGKEPRPVVVSQRTRLGEVTPPIQIQFPGPRGEQQRAQFFRAFIIGRGEDCAVRLSDPIVSRHHTEIFPEGDTWWVRDLKSSNGTLIGGRAIDRLPMIGTVTLELGNGGPHVRVIAPPKPRAGPPTADVSPRSLSEISSHYLDGNGSAPAGERTMLIRQAFKDAKRRQKRLYHTVIGIALAILVGLGGLTTFQYLQLQKMSNLANDIFYGMKELEVYVANLEADLEADLGESRLARRREEIAEARRKLTAMRENYDAYVRELRASRLFALDSEELLILRMARVFGETEVDVPGDFVREVQNYIKKWQSSPRLANAIQRLRDNNYSPTIYQALTSQGLAPQFMYLALQESGFQLRAVGPPTRYGRAKGMWQFIPSTAERYGLRVGPLQDSGNYDPGDERHDLRKASLAAARYLKYIYRTDAQASGLLVMASYNWGEGNIIKRIRQMPNNPRERNFWELLRHHRIPDETYDYVFYIFSAAVICENPRLFGFDFENPLQGLQ